MSYINDPEFLKCKEVYINLANKTKALADEVYYLQDIKKKLSKIDELTKSIIEFDNHIKSMIEKFPDYYKDFKKVVDNILTENNNFLAAAIAEAQSLSVYNKKDYSIN